MLNISPKFTTEPISLSGAAEAWAVASMAPARSGSLGYCASAWAITYDNWATIAHRGVVPSHGPGRDEWLAGIMAIRGVLEHIEPGTFVTVYVPNEALATCYLSGWRNRQGKPLTGADAADPIFQLRDALRLDLRVVHRSLNAIAAPLKAEAKAAAAEKDRTLTLTERRKVPAAKRATPFNQYGGFPPADEQEGDGE